MLADQIAVYRQIFTVSMASAKKLDAATRHFLEVEPDRTVDDNEVLPGVDMPEPVVTCLACQVPYRYLQALWYLLCTGTNNLDQDSSNNC